MNQLILALLMLSLSGCYVAGDEYAQLRDENRKVVARLSKIDCPNHYSIWYQYEFQGQLHTGKAEWGSIDCPKARVGDPIDVYVSVKRPGLSTNIPPDEAFARHSGWRMPWWLPALIVLGAMFVLGPRPWRNRSRGE